jgi:hypothetical protein
MRKSGSLFFLLRNCSEKAEMRVGNMRGVASLTLHQRRQQWWWCGEEFGHLRKNLGTYEFSFGYPRICFWVPTYIHLGTYGFSFGYLRIRTASREACGRDQVPNTSLVLQPSDLVCHYLLSQDLDSFIVLFWTSPRGREDFGPSDLVCHYLFSQDLDSFIVLFWTSPRGREDFGPSDWDKKRVAWNDQRTNERTNEGLTVNAGSIFARGPGRV